MTWRNIENSLTADSSDMNDNFGHLASGSIEPFSSAGVSFVSTNSVYDLGTTTAKWKDVYVGQPYCNTITNIKLWELVSEVTFTATASSFEFNGINGDDYDDFMILSYLKIQGTGAIQSNMVINGDSSSNYYRRYMDGRDNLVFVSLGTTTSMQVNEFIATNGSMGFSRTILKSKTGGQRTAINISTGQFSATSIYSTRCEGMIWNNTSDTITSLKIYILVGTAFMTNSVFQLWGR